jgi:hypothetical protein
VTIIVEDVDPVVAHPAEPGRGLERLTSRPENRRGGVATLDTSKIAWVQAQRGNILAVEQRL